MAETLQDSEKAQDMESRIKSALFSRSSYFAQQADSLTLEGVRRLLEKDLGLETHALDSHRRFVKVWLYKCIGAASADTSAKHQDGAGGDDVSERGADQLDKGQAKKEEEDLSSKGEDKMDDSPVMGLMTGSKRVKTGADSSEATNCKGVLSESTIKKAVWARASYLKENSENVTLGSLRRLLEEDLKLDKLSLDRFKAYIKQQVDEILQPPESPPKTAVDKKKNLKKGVPKPKKEESPASSENESDEDQEDEVKVRKRGAPKGKFEKSESSKRRKRGDEGNKGAKSKQSKVSKSKSKSEGVDEEDDGNVSENDNSVGSAEKPVKRKEVPKQSFGKQVERLRSVIKSCGLSVPPSIYKKVKQAPEKKREASLIKELEDILAKEGLSSNPSEKEIKDVKKRKERARELEGIDLSNIVSSSRRRSTSSFVPPPKPQIPDVSESESEESEDEDDEEDEEVDNVEGDEDQENGDDNSQNEESEADDGGSD